MVGRAPQAGTPTLAVGNPPAWGRTCPALRRTRWLQDGSQWAAPAVDPDASSCPLPEQGELRVMPRCNPPLAPLHVQRGFALVRGTGHCVRCCVVSPRCPLHLPSWGVTVRDPAMRIPARHIQGPIAVQAGPPPQGCCKEGGCDGWAAPKVPDQDPRGCRWPRDTDRAGGWH